MKGDIHILPILKNSFLTFLFFMITGFFTISYALPFTITPKSGTFFSSNLTMPAQGSSLTVYYTVTNNTGSSRNNNYVKYLPPNVSQVTNGGTYSDTCRAQFNLAPKGQTGDSCTLQLIARGLVNGNDPDPHHHLFVCFPGGTTCAGTNNALNIVEGANDLARAAVGHYVQGSSSRPITYMSQDGGNSWTVFFPPLHPDTTGNSTLQGISCAANNRLLCTAVGYYIVSSVRHPLAYISQDGGNSWSLAPTQPPYQGTGNSELDDVSCAGNNGLLCTAVGYYISGSQKAISYLSRDGGNTWSLSLVPPTPELSRRLSAVSCVGNNGLLCTAVGISASTSPQRFRAFISQDGGNTWSFSSTPETGDTDVLNDVSCSGNNGLLCSATGTLGTTNTPSTFISQDGGANWVRSAGQPAPLTTGSNVIGGVSCVGLLCSAVGNYLTPSGTNSQPLSYVSSDGGNTWLRSSTLPPGLGIPNTLRSVICRGNTSLFCTAVGLNQPSGASAQQPVAYISQDGGNTWSPATMQPPYQGTTGNSSLESID